MIKSIRDETPSVRQVLLSIVTFKNHCCLQAAVYGIGIMAQFCTKDFAQTCIG